MAPAKGAIEAPHTPEKFLRLKQVCELTGIAPSTLYRKMLQGKFPRPHAVSRRLVVWPESEVAKWQASIKQHD